MTRFYDLNIFKGQGHLRLKITYVKHKVNIFRHHPLTEFQIFCFKLFVVMTRTSDPNIFKIKVIKG